VAASRSPVGNMLGDLWSTQSPCRSAWRLNCAWSLHCSDYPLFLVPRTAIILGLSLILGATYSSKEWFVTCPLIPRREHNSRVVLTQALQMKAPIQHSTRSQEFLAQRAVPLVVSAAGNSLILIGRLADYFSINAPFNWLQGIRVNLYTTARRVCLTKNQYYLALPLVCSLLLKTDFDFNFCSSIFVLQFFVLRIKLR